MQVPEKGLDLDNRVARSERFDLNFTIEHSVLVSRRILSSALNGGVPQSDRVRFAQPRHRGLV